MSSKINPAPSFGKGWIKKNIPSLITAGYLFLPLTATAQDIETIIRNVTSAARTVINILLVLATLVFLWGVVQFIAGSGDPSKRDKAKGIMMWGIIGLAVMAAAWGAAWILIAYFQATTTPTIPPGPMPL